jgi:hypothetical protein
MFHRSIRSSPSIRYFGPLFQKKCLSSSGMESTSAPIIRELHINDKINAWKSIGFNVDSTSGVFNIGAVRLNVQETNTSSSGIVGVGFLNPFQRNIHKLDDINVWSLDKEHVRPPNGDSQHINGVYKIDHIVIKSCNIDAIHSKLVNDIGLTLRKRTSDIIPGTEQLFYRENHFSKDTPIIEVIRSSSSSSLSPASVWGISFVVPCLNQLRDAIGHSHTSDIRVAKQQGREICTLRKSALLSTQVAFMTPHNGKTH